MILNCDQFSHGMTGCRVDFICLCPRGFRHSLWHSYLPLPTHLRQHQLTFGPVLFPSPSNTGHRRPYPPGRASTTVRPLSTPQGWWPLLLATPFFAAASHFGQRALAPRGSTRFRSRWPPCKPCRSFPMHPQYPSPFSSRQGGPWASPPRLVFASVMG